MVDGNAVRYTIGGKTFELRVVGSPAATFTYSVRFQGDNGEFAPWISNPDDGFETEGDAYAAGLKYASSF